MKIFVPAALLLLLLSYLVYPRLAAKWSFDQASKGVTLAVDWDDLKAYSKDRKAEDSLKEFIKVGAGAVAVSAVASLEEEEQIRKYDRPVFWKLEDGRDSTPLFDRFTAGDGVLILGEHVMENPYLLAGLKDLLLERRGVFTYFEMQPRKSRIPVPSGIWGRVLKAHLLPSREMLTPAQDHWRSRLRRAVRERSVQVLYLRLSPVLSVQENIRFWESLDIHSEPARPFLEDSVLKAGWEKMPARKIYSNWLCVILPVLAPLLGLFACLKYPGRPPIFSFLLFSIISTAAGVIVHGLGVSYATIMGLATLRGVKLQLVAPLFLGFFLLVSWERIMKFGDTSIKWKHVGVGGGLLGVLGILYLSRSGNFPLVPASGVELDFRNWLEAGLGARPRTKEFLFGHPLLILGLYTRQKLQRGSLLIWAGVIGQISIINTFTHFHAPFMLSLLRTFHGIWMGTLLAVPLCYVASLLLKRVKMKS